MSIASAAAIITAEAKHYEDFIDIGSNQGHFPALSEWAWGPPRSPKEGHRGGLISLPARFARLKTQCSRTRQGIAAKEDKGSCGYSR
jgi:hypothetical protein